MKKFFFALIALLAFLVVIFWSGLLPAPSGGEAGPASPTDVPTP